MGSAAGLFGHTEFFGVFSIPKIHKFIAKFAVNFSMNTLLNLVFFNEFLDECITKCLVKLNIIWYYFEIFGIFSKYLVMHQIWGLVPVPRY